METNSLLNIMILVLESDKLKADKEICNSPKHNVTTDSLGLMVRKYDRSSKRTTLINDDVRVYKGGSWRQGVLVRSCSKKVFSTRYGY
jgi:hypothetical protein